MILKKAAFKILPVETFISLRTYYRKFLKLVHKPLSEGEFRNILSNHMGLHEGSVVFIHSSVDALHISFPLYRMLEILLETVGESGTLVFPAWHFTYRAEEYLSQDLVFDVQHSPSMLGLLPELARRHPDAKRSIHPTTSIVAIGNHSNEILSGHGDSIWPCDEKSPYYKIMKYNGIIVGIGVNNNFMSFVHCPEDVLKKKFPIKTRLDKVFEAKVKMKDGTIKIVKTLAAHPQIKNNNIPHFVNKYISNSVCKNLSIKGNKFFIAHSKELFDSMIKLSHENKTIYTKGAVIRNS